MIRFIRRWIYRLGGRPKSESVWYSPSAAWVYYFKDSYQVDREENLLKGDNDD